MSAVLPRGERDAIRAEAAALIEDPEFASSLHIGGMEQDLARLVEKVPALLDALDAAEEENERLREALADMTGARRVAADSADRFRDVLCECLGHSEDNPGDDVLVAEIRAHFGKTGPEPTRWRDFLTGALARLDQIRAMPDPVRRALAAAPSETEEGQ